MESPYISRHNLWRSSSISGYDNGLMDVLNDNISRAASCAAEIYKAKSEVTFTPVAKVTYNTPELAGIARNSVEKMFGSQALAEFKEQAASEDFSDYCMVKPCAFALVGCGSKAKNCVFQHHSSKFVIDEDALPIGAALYAQFAMDYLNRNNL